MSLENPESSDVKNTNNAQPVPIIYSNDISISNRQLNPRPHIGPLIQSVPNGKTPVSSAIVVNQVVPTMTVMANTSYPFATTCPFCKKGITTTSVQTCSCKACLLCYFTGCLFYVCIQCCRGKDFCCYDAVHSCPECGNTIAQYIAC